MAPKKQDLAIRFWSKVDKSGACWLWIGPLDDKGYGAITVSNDGVKRVVGAHRVAYELTYGSIPSGMCVCHDCPNGDNPRCVNPDHLWLGTKGDNNRDTRDKGRGNYAQGTRHGSKTKPVQFRTRHGKFIGTANSNQEAHSKLDTLVYEELTRAA